MSLANPNSVVTEQKLSEYHQRILPYLGGMPEMVANKFSKGDLYSTEERMIGQWIDGKPLYQKVYNNIAVSPSVNEFDVTSLNIDNIVSMNGKYVYNNDYVYNFSHIDPNGGLTYACDLLFRKETNKITFLIGSAINTGNVSILILQYTKTTDSPISIGSDTDYSTTEKIIGTWIDGKPLYQKTISTTMPVVTSSATIHDVSVGVSIDTLVELKWISDTDGLCKASFDLAGANNENVLKVMLFTNKYSDSALRNMIRIYSSNSANNDKPIYVTIQYTKTTD